VEFEPIRIAREEEVTNHEGGSELPPC